MSLNHLIQNCCCISCWNEICLLQNLQARDREMTSVFQSIASPLFSDGSNNFRFCKGSNLCIVTISASTRCSLYTFLQSQKAIRQEQLTSNINISGHGGHSSACTQVLDCTLRRHSKLASKSNRNTTAMTVFSPGSKTCTGPYREILSAMLSPLLQAATPPSEPELVSSEHICGN